MKKILAMFLLTILVLQVGCLDYNINVVSGKSSYTGKGVTITDKGNYFDVELDYTKGLSHKQIGEEYAKGILKVVPDYETLIDSYIAENLLSNEYNQAFWRVEDVKPQLEEKYKDEIEGMAGAFSGGNSDVRGDNKISADEFYLFNLFLDVVRNTQCSFVSVYGSRSATGKTITGKILDWYGGDKNQLPKIQAVITIKSPEGKICSIGYMGFMGIITGFNDSKIFASVQESQSGAPYSSTGKRSYSMDLRYALENMKTLDKTIEFMKDSKKQYAVNHLIVFSDPQVSKVLENNFSGPGTGTGRVKRAVRTSDSKLNDGITWGFKDAIACVNSFLLYGNHDNHTEFTYNTFRWGFIKDQLSKKASSKVTKEDIKNMMSFCGGSPSSFFDTKYLYTKSTLSIAIFEPDTLNLEMYFFPKNSLKVPDKPTFEKIHVNW
ncbi:MAG TPA: C45 family peptidase [Clostridia bacterium]